MPEANKLLPPFHQCFNGAWVERQGPSGSEGEGNPVFAAGETAFLREEEAAAGAAG
jgi:hypothetical protein